MQGPDRLERGRGAYRRGAWADAHRSLSLADQTAPLGADDLERLARAAFFIHREDEFLSVLERAHHARLHAGETFRAARCAFWLGLNLLFRGERGPATGWLARAQRLIEGRDCVEQGYLLLPVAEQQLRKEEFDAAYTTASDAALIADRFEDADLLACARHLQGRALVGQGQVQAGLTLLDEAMVAVTAGELTPMVTGLIYCSVLDTCRRAYVLSRAREWTSAMALWCARQPEMVAFTATCLVHRAEILQLSGAWPEAIEEAQRACSDPKPPASAFYQEAEVHRLRGEFEAAEEAYRNASRGGREPQPGLALLRLAQGRSDAAAAGIRRALSATAGPEPRSRLLPAFIEIMLAVGATEEARAACRELEEIAQHFDTDVWIAIAAHARGAIELAEGAAQEALGFLRRAHEAWQRVDAPYGVARARELAGLACHALGDDDGAKLEADAARALFAKLGAAPDLARLDALAARATPDNAGRLTPRELQVLRLVATGKTNKAIAGELSLSEKTIDRHVSNIFTKLNVTSRTAATAYAYEHKLI